jgi:hypothetical protein
MIRGLTALLHSTFLRHKYVKIGALPRVNVIPRKQNVAGDYPRARTPTPELLALIFFLMRTQRLLSFCAISRENLK